MKQLIQKVKTLSHEWKVLTKKKFGKVNYYLLEDCTKKDSSLYAGIPLYKVVKESVDPMEHFTGRIVEYLDKELLHEHEKTVVKTKPHGGHQVVTNIVKEPWIHKLWDHAVASVDEGIDMFGDYFDPLVFVPVRVVSNEESWELLFTTSKKEKESTIKHSNRKTKESATA